MKRGFIVAAVVGLAVVGGAFLYKNSLPMAIIKSPLPNTVVGQKFTITGSAPLDWFSDNLTTMTIRTAEGFLLSSGGAAVQRGSTHDGLTDFTIHVDLGGSDGSIQPPGPIVITIEPMYQNILDVADAVINKGKGVEEGIVHSKDALVLPVTVKDD